MNQAELTTTVPLPQGVSVTVKGATVTVKGKNGELHRTLFHPGITFTVGAEEVAITAKDATKREKKMLYTFASHLKNMIEGADKTYCPIDAPPKERWQERAAHRLQLLAISGRSCKPVLDKMAQHNIVHPDPKQMSFLEVQCLVNAGDCAGAKKKYIAWLMPKNPDPDNVASLEASHAKGFHEQFKTCPP